jgi:hypothetical protein
MPSRVVGWGGTLTFGGTAIPVRNVTITRQTQEIDVTAHGDTSVKSGPGRVKRGGTFEAYVGTGHANVVTAIETPTWASLPTLSFNDAGGNTHSMEVIVTSAEFSYAAEDAAVYTVTFVEGLEVT